MFPSAQVSKFPSSQIPKYPSSQKGILIILYIYFRPHQHEIPNALPGKNGRRESTIIIFKSEFFFQPFLGGGEFTNAITGKIKLVKEVLVTLDGHWDDTVMMKDKKTGVSLFIFFKKFALIVLQFCVNTIKR